MARPLDTLKRFFRELQRRNVYKVGAAYLVAAFVVLQLASMAAGAFALPSWFEPMTWVLCGLGLPLALVVAWAFEVTPEGVRRTPETVPTEEGAPEEPDGTPEAGRWAPRVLVLIGLLGAAGAGLWYLTGAGGGAPDIGERTLAVLPFRAADAAVEPWREGMVSVLGIKMDGAGGLRAVSDRAVFAAWEGQGLDEREASTEETLAVARRVGAAYALFGSASQFGQELHLTAQLYESRSGERLEQFEVRGRPDSVSALADSLARRALSVLLEADSGGLESVELGTLSTGSFDALKAYLRGERHFRGGDYRQAIAAYRAAVEADSTFALAHARLARSLGWVGESALSEWRRANAHADRLRRRERRAIHAAYLQNVVNRSLVAADTLRRLTRDYPDDPALWYDLGEVLFHEALPDAPSEAEEAFRQATRLDPGVAPYERHLVDLAFSFHHDSALAADRIAEYPEGQGQTLYRLAWDLAFASPADSARAMAAFDTVAFTGSTIVVNLALSHPEDLDLSERVHRRVLARDDGNRPAAVGGLIEVEWRRGQMDDALALLREAPAPPESRDGLLTSWHSLGLPVPDSLLRRHLDPSAFADPAEIPCLPCVGTYLVEQGRGGELDPLLRRYRERAGESAGMARDVSLDRVRDLLHGYRAWRNGEPERALELWRDENPLQEISAVWRGDVFRELGRLEQAAAWYRAGWMNPVAHERLGQVYEELGRPEAAAAAYRRFVTAWEEADPELQPRVEEARRRLEGLDPSGSR